MRRQRARDTAPELAVRRLLHAQGLRYRVDAPLPVDRRRRADVLHGPSRVALFVDGCFWHGCPDHWRPPRTNTAWWEAKIGANRARDADTDARLREVGWLPVRVWEHDDPGAVAGLVLAAVALRRRSG
jgi:DNA mismatch endonuclease (patch repair protein)